MTWVEENVDNHKSNDLDASAASGDKIGVATSQEFQVEGRFRMVTEDGHETNEIQVYRKHRKQPATIFNANNYFRRINVQAFRTYFTHNLID